MKKWLRGWNWGNLAAGIVILFVCSMFWTGVIYWVIAIIN